MEDAPTWPIYEDGDGRILWDRIPDGAEASDLVDAHSIAGGHTDPGDVPAWLEARHPIRGRPAADGVTTACLAS